MPVDQETSGKTNVVFILTDDQGPWAMGCAGNPEIRTPNLDRLAASGIRFENFFCASPVCSPSRASFFTGRIPSQHGVHDWIREGNVPPDAVEYLAGLKCYTEVLAENGYTCGMSGKWHLGSSHKPQAGFSHWFLHQRGGGDYNNAPMVRMSETGEYELYDAKGYVTNVITDDALAFLDENAARPFYLSLHYTAPHGPWGPDEHPEDVRALYADCGFASCPREPFHPLATYKFDEANFRQCLIGYFAAVTAMDAGVGRLLACLDELGLRDNTLVFFVSDNGFNCGHHGIWGKGNGTLVPNMFDTSVKVPAIASHPGVIPSGVVSDAMVSGYDFMPTLLDYVGVAVPEDPDLPGTSRASALLGESYDSDGEIVVFDEYGPVRMIRTPEWKYVHRYGSFDHELYDIHGDPDERRNLIEEGSAQSTVSDLRGRLERWFGRYVDPSVDALAERVCGAGQIGLSGRRGKGMAFITEREVSFDPSHDPGMDRRNKS